ncbi:GPP34 family phosphoprotein [Kitasatospora sp. NPDC050543]|uniref:GOLPH3/VPS74 family protein n=1 Tax=Kitasatospora sp. NPDC050543 TaxID=3364054 RepID=UPI003788D47A
MLTPMPPLTLPEELLLLCADPGTGRVDLPPCLDEMVGGAVLAELRLAGAIAVDGRYITEVRPTATGDVLVDRALGELSRTAKGGRPQRLRRSVRRTSDRAARRYLESLTARGLLSAAPTRVLGIFRSTRYTVSRPERTSDLLARLYPVLHPHSQVAGPAGVADGVAEADGRAVQLAALAGAGGLDRRLFEGPGRRERRRRVRALTLADPIASAVRRESRREDFLSSFLGYLFAGG